MRIAASFLFLLGCAQTYAGLARGHARSRRQLASVLDPLGLLNGASEKLRAGMESLGENFSSHVQSVGQLVQQGVRQVHEGLQEVGNVAKIDSSDAATDADQNGNHVDNNESGDGLINNVLRMIGVDPDNLGTMALEIIVYLAETIATTLAGDIGEMGQERSGDSPLLSWILEGNSQLISDTFQQLQDSSLPRNLIKTLIDESGNDTACVQLLVCKLSPVVWGLQAAYRQSVEARSIDVETTAAAIDAFYSFLPSLTDFARFSESCEVQFPACPLLDINGDDDGADVRATEQEYL